jgi:hypothetical protein
VTRVSLNGLEIQIPPKRQDDLAEEAGVCSLKRESLDFHGDLLMEAKLSDTQTGFKRLLLKAIDPFFGRKGGGSTIPIRVSGTRRDPDFGIDRSRLFSRK